MQIFAWELPLTNLSVSRGKGKNRKKIIFIQIILFTSFSYLFVDMLTFSFYFLVCFGFFFFLLSVLGCCALPSFFLRLTLFFLLQSSVLLSLAFLPSVFDDLSIPRRVPFDSFTVRTVFLKRNLPHPPLLLLAGLECTSAIQYLFTYLASLLILSFFFFYAIIVLFLKPHNHMAAMGL